MINKWDWLLLSGLARTIAAHSWVEQLLVIRNGTYSGNPGYMRGYNPRGPAFSDALNDNLLPPLATGRIRIDGSDFMCKSIQQTSNYTNAYPKLRAAAGDYVALRYLENGHVTLPQNQIGKPGSGGTVLVFATDQPREDEKLMDVLKWNTKGTGGDRRGKLLSVQNFDDGRCYQINTSPMSVSRQTKFPNKPVDAPPGTANEEMWCETDIKLPAEAKPNADLTLYWAWQWNTLPGRDPGIPKGKDEWYTSCIDISIYGPGQVRLATMAPPVKLLVQDPQQSANPDFVVRAKNVTLPDGGPEGGDGNLGDAIDPISTDPTLSAPTAPASSVPAPPPPGQVASETGSSPAIPIIPVPPVKKPSASPPRPSDPARTALPYPTVNGTIAIPSLRTATAPASSRPPPPQPSPPPRDGRLRTDTNDGFIGAEETTSATQYVTLTRTFTFEYSAPGVAPVDVLRAGSSSGGGAAQATATGTSGPGRVRRTAGSGSRFERVVDGEAERERRYRPRRGVA